MKKLSAVLLMMLMVFALAACGSKSQEDVVRALDKKLNEMSGYKAEATMTLQTGEKPLTYEIEVWHKKPHFYRVSLKNAERDQNQMILRNNDGVFVLTPALNKSFKFQSDWPENSSQVYLIESLVSDILNDEKPSFKAEDESYVFNTRTNYQNKNLYQQQIALDKDSLLPKSVKVMDKEMKVLVNLKFNKINTKAQFDEGSFDMERNMQSALTEIPTMATTDQESEMTIHYPSITPDNTELTSQQEFVNGDTKEFVLTFTGEKPFTLIQRESKVTPATSMLSMGDGQPVNLSGVFGVMDENSIAWSQNGVEYYLASKAMTQEELMTIASSISDQAMK